MRHLSFEYELISDPDVTWILFVQGGLQAYSNCKQTQIRFLTQRTPTIIAVTAEDHPTLVLSRDYTYITHHVL